MQENKQQKIWMPAKFTLMEILMEGLNVQDSVIVVDQNKTCDSCIDLYRICITDIYVRYKQEMSGFIGLVVYC